MKELKDLELKDLVELIKSLLVKFPSLRPQSNPLLTINTKNKGLNSDNEINEIIEDANNSLQSSINELIEKAQPQGLILYDSNECFYEIPIYGVKNILNYLENDDNKLAGEDSDQGLSYEISIASHGYLAFILFRLEEGQGLLNKFFTRKRLHSGGLEIYKSQRDWKPSEVVEYINRKSSLYTLKIKSSQPKNINEIKKLTEAVIYQLCCRWSLPIIEIRDLNDLVNSGRKAPGKSDNEGNILPPHKKYISALMYEYQMAISTDNSSSQFLSYYRIIEYFYGDIVKKEFKQIEEILNSPGINYPSKEISIFLVKYWQNDKKITENDSICLVLKKYVNNQSLIEKIRGYNSDLLEYYKNEEVSFCQGKKVNLMNPDTHNVYRDLGQRIYKTRNSIVHNKKDEPAMYEPFKHDPELQKEIPLMRFIAEEIIENSGELI